MVMVSRGTALPSYVDQMRSVSLSNLRPYLAAMLFLAWLPGSSNSICFPNRGCYDVVIRETYRARIRSHAPLSIPDWEMEVEERMAD